MLFPLLFSVMLNVKKWLFLKYFSSDFSQKHPLKPIQKSFKSPKVDSCQGLCPWTPKPSAEWKQGDLPPDPSVWLCTTNVICHLLIVIFHPSGASYNTYLWVCFNPITRTIMLQKAIVKPFIFETPLESISVLRSSPAWIFLFEAWLKS